MFASPFTSMHNTTLHQLAAITSIYHSMKEKVVKKQETLRANSGFGLIELFAVLVVGAILVFIVFTFFFSRARESGVDLRLRCQGNFKSITATMIQYAFDYNSFPCGERKDKDSDVTWRHPGILYPRYVGALSLFICPGSNDREFTRSGESVENFDHKELGLYSDKEIISYSYGRKYSDETGVQPLDLNSAPDRRVIADKVHGKLDPIRGNHRGEGRNVGYIDGHVEWISKEKDYLRPFSDMKESDFGYKQKDAAKMFSSPPYQR
jgi:prepilin-type processing-associated H-X9-DG protein